MSGIVSVPVPEEHLLEVYALLARLGGKVEASDSKEDASEKLGWSVEELRALRDCPLASVQTVGRTLDILAAQPKKPMAYTELADGLGVTRKQLQGALSGFTRWIRKEWGPEDDWPIDIAYGPATASDLTSEGYYSVGEQTASRWLQVRGE